MKYGNYKRAVEKLENKTELERLLKFLEDDEEISARKYENLRHLIIKKIYA